MRIGLILLFAGLSSAANAQQVNVTVLSQKDTSAGVNGRLQAFMSTSFQPAEWDFQFFPQHPAATAPLWKLAPRHIRIQPISQGTPQKSPDLWDFTDLDSVLIPVLSVGDHSPELQIAAAPTFMNDSQGHLMSSHFQDFANYCANLVRYYNAGGFDAGDKHYQSPSPYHIIWWGIFNEPNINGISGDDYVALYNLVVPAMHAVDPDIKFAAVELSDFDVEPQKMLPPFVQKVTAQVDVVATHYYASCNQRDSDSSVMNAVTDFTNHIRYIYSQLRSNPALAKVPVWVTENNVNADFDKGGGISACNGTQFVTDLRGSSAFFAAWRPLVFSRLAKAGVESLYHWDYDADPQFGEVNYDSGSQYLSYWVDYWLAHLFPSPPGADILQLRNTDAGAIEALAVRNDDGSVVVMLANYSVRSSVDNNGPGITHSVTLDVSALGNFSSATQVAIDATTDPAAGPAPQTIALAPQIQVALNGYSVAFLRLNQPKPQFPANGVVNAASYGGGGVSPGEIVAVFGTAMGPQKIKGALASSPGIVDNYLAGTRVYFDGIAAPLVYSGAKQLSAIVPYEVAGKTSTQMQIEYLGLFSDPITVPVVASAPGIFTNDYSGAGQGAILNQDGTRNSASNPADRDTIVSIYATGEGQTGPAGVDGKIASIVLPKPQLAVSVTIGGMPAEVPYAGGASGIVAGGIQINTRVPAKVTPGPSVPVLIAISTATSQAGVTMAVR